MIPSEAPSRNNLLSALPHRERDRVLALCEHVTLTRDEILGEPGERIDYVYFPIDSFISLLTELDKHEALGVALVGCEGMLGTSLVLGVHTSPLRARVQGTGTALRMKAADFQRILLEAPILERQLRLYLHVLFAQVAQTAACAAFHVVEVRLACWLLMTHDRVHGDRFYLTHDLLSRMLGVRRSGVTAAAGVLHGRKLINYTRGRIAVLDRKGLERASCGCYRSVRNTIRQIAPVASHHDHIAPVSEHDALLEADRADVRPPRQPQVPTAEQTSEQRRPLPQAPLANARSRAPKARQEVSAGPPPPVIAANRH